jgi:hypothetical protein
MDTTRLLTFSIVYARFPRGVPSAPRSRPSRRARRWRRSSGSTGSRRKETRVTARSTRSPRSPKTWFPPALSVRPRVVQISVAATPNAVRVAAAVLSNDRRAAAMPPRPIDSAMTPGRKVAARGQSPGSWARARRGPSARLAPAGSSPPAVRPAACVVAPAAAHRAHFVVRIPSSAASTAAVTRALVPVEYPLSASQPGPTDRCPTPSTGLGTGLR